jgi:ATP-dependent DNA helicase RecG
MTTEQLMGLINNLESDRIERTTSFREDKPGPAVCALSNDFPNHRQQGYILLGVNDNGTIANMKIGDEELQKIGNIKSNGDVLPQPSLSASEIFRTINHRNLTCPY